MLTYLDDQSYGSLLDYLGNLHLTDRPAQAGDVVFLSEDWWLGDTAVIEQVTLHRGMWQVSLVFAHHQRPLQLIRRLITQTSHQSKAQLMAALMRRLAAKDQRGTLAVRACDFNFAPY
jgi:hypothetical protein